MRKKLSKSIIAVIVMLSLLSEAWSTSFQSNKPIINNAPDDVEIKDVINSYFKLRYETFSTLILGDFSDLLATSDEAKAFQHAEFGKLTIEIKNAEKNQLRYTSYNFSLVFSKIRFDNSFQTATVHVTEENSVVYEISQEASPTNPVISSISNLKHTITLREEQSGWRIVSDYYDDLLWRLIRETGVSIDEVIRTVD